MTKKKPGWFDLPVEEVARRTTAFAKGYLAHKAEETSSPLSHDEYMEQAELWAEQSKEDK